jgi:hypothetical protein
MEYVTDYTGATIVFTAERRQHVLNHPEMRDLLEDLPTVLKEPTFVRQSI